MNKSDMAKILSILRANYPNVRIENPEAMVKTWLLTLGEFSGQAVMKSAELHMKSSKFFPTPAELRENIVRSRIPIDPPPTAPMLTSGKRAKCTAIPDGMSEEEFLDSIIQHQIDLETEMENNGFLRFER